MWVNPDHFWPALTSHVALSRCNELAAVGPAAPGSVAPERWNSGFPDRGLDRADSAAGQVPGAGPGNGVNGAGGAGVKRYNSPQLNKIYNHLLGTLGEKLPPPPINPEVGCCRWGRTRATVAGL